MQAFQIVIDTNVIVAGLRSNQGNSFRLLQLIGREQFDIHLSVPLILEYHDVLLRQLPRLQLTKSDIEDLIDYYCAIAKNHKIFYLWRPVLRDPNDEMVLEIAVKAECDFIITFNKRDFQGSEKFGIITLTPNEFLKKLGVQ